MSNFCGGFKFPSDFLDIINGVVCSADAHTVDKSKAVSTCGQLWDGEFFAVTNIGGSKCITLRGSVGEEFDKPILMRGPCGVGLDGRFFMAHDNLLGLLPGFLLTVNVLPEDATIIVTDVNGEEVDLAMGNNQYLLNGFGETYTVTTTKTGYVTETKQVKNTGKQTITIVMKQDKS